MAVGLQAGWGRARGVRRPAGASGYGESSAAAGRAETVGGDIGDLALVFFFQAEDGIRDLTVTEFRRVLFRSRVPLVIVEVVDRAHRELVMQILAHRGDLRVAERGLLEDLADLRAVERGRLGDLLDRRGVERSLLEEGPDRRVVDRGFLEQPPDRRVVERSLLGEPPDRRVADRGFLGDLPDLRVAERDLLEELPPLRHQLDVRRERHDVEQRALSRILVSRRPSVAGRGGGRDRGLRHWPGRPAGLLGRGGAPALAGRAKVESAGELLEELPPRGGDLAIIGALGSVGRGRRLGGDRRVRLYRWVLGKGNDRRPERRRRPGRRRRVLARRRLAWGRAEPEPPRRLRPLGERRRCGVARRPLRLRRSLTADAIRVPGLPGLHPPRPAGG